MTKFRKKNQKLFINGLIMAGNSIPVAKKGLTNGK